MTSSSILVVAPTKRELGGLRESDARAAVRRTDREASARAAVRRTDHEAAPQVRIALCGIGQDAGERVAALLDTAPPSLLVSLGFAGALDPALRPGDLVVADAFLRAGAPSLALPDSLSLQRPLHDFRLPSPVLSPAACAASSPLIGRGGKSDADSLSLQGERAGERVLETQEERRRLPHALAGAVLTVDAPLLTPAAKRRARAESGAVAVDMEGRRIAEAAAERGVPLVAVRATLDEADFALPAFAAEIAAAGGHDERARAFRAAANPREAAGMLLLALRARKAARSLRRAADAILAAAPERL